MNVLRELRLLRSLVVPSTSRRCFAAKRVEADEIQLTHVNDHFTSIPKQHRNKHAYNAAVELYVRRTRGTGRGAVEFINTALKYLKEYNVHKDLDTYKALLNVFPKGIMIPQNVFQKYSLHYPMQQICCVRVLDEMEWNCVQPDKELHEIVKNTFGEWNFATKKAKRMLYWMPKLKHRYYKYLDRREVENGDLNGVELAHVALRMMCRDSGTEISYAKTSPPSELPEDKSKSQWIVSAQSPLQQHIVKRLPKTTVFYVDGPSLVYVMDKPVRYFVLSTDAREKAVDEVIVDQRTLHDFSNIGNTLKPLPEESFSMHEQADQTICAMAVLQENTRDLASAWINHLQKQNSRLEECSILFRFGAQSTEVQLAEARVST